MANPNPEVRVDHLIVHCPDPVAALAEFAQELDLPVVAPVADFGFFQSGTLRLGNLDLEFFGYGTSPPPRPRFYGIAFTSSGSIWQTAAWLKRQGIPHSVPVATAVARDGTTLRWTVTMLGGLLDDPIPAGYSRGALAGDGPMARSVAFVSNQFLRIPGIRSATARESRRSMALFCHYGWNIDETRRASDEELRASGGGEHGVRRVSEVRIQTSSAGPAWARLLQRCDGGTVVRRTPGPANRLEEIVLESTRADSPRTLVLGDVRFRLEPA